MRSRRRRLICRWTGVVILVVWALSFWRGIAMTWNVHSSAYGTPPRWPSVNIVAISRGLLYAQFDIPVRRSPGVEVFGGKKMGRWGSWSDYAIGRITAQNAWTGRILIVPATAPLGLSATLIGLSYWRRRPKGHCPKCGYDLTGITDKCPECGRTITPVKNA